MPGGLSGGMAEWGYREKIFVARLRNRPLLIVGVTMLLLLAVFFLLAGKGIVANNPPEDSDVIIVLMGSGPDRILGAVDLYEQGYAPCIMMVENWQPGYELLESRGVSLPRDAELAAEVGMQLGVAEESLLILPGNARSTQDEAIIISKYIAEHSGLQKVILVSSEFHSYRSAKIFRWAFSRAALDVEVLSCPTPYDTFDATNWWKSREDAKRVIMEYAKLVNFYLLDRWR